MQVIITTDSKLQASICFWAQVLLHFILYRKGRSLQQVKNVQKLIVLHPQDHVPFSPVPKATPLGFDIVGFCFRNHCVEGVQVSQSQKLAQDTHNFLLCFPSRLAGISCVWMTFLSGEAGPTRELFEGSPMLTLRVIFILPLQIPVFACLSHALFNSLLYLRIYFGFGLFWIL